MPTSNIDRFDLLTGKLFATLYEAFPMGKWLTASQFSDVIAVDPIETPEGETQIVEADEFFTYSMEWLSRSGYISYTLSGRNPANFSECILTAKGLEVLKAIPDSLSSESIGSRLKGAATGGMLDSVKSLTGKALSIGATMGYTAATSFINS